jgi:sec-independent protein translocase protein TatA
MSVGAGQILLIIIAILILFGAGKLPSVMADLAKGLRAFKKGMSEDDAQIAESQTNIKKD